MKIADKLRRIDNTCVSGLEHYLTLNKIYIVINLYSGIFANRSDEIIIEDDKKGHLSFTINKGSDWSMNRFFLPIEYKLLMKYLTNSVYMKSHL